MFILWVFRFISKMSQESQVNLNFVDYALLCLRLFAISISPQSEERQVWPVGCLRAGCKIGRHQKWQCRLILKNLTVCYVDCKIMNAFYVTFITSNNGTMERFYSISLTILTLHYVECDSSKFNCFCSLNT